MSVVRLVIFMVLLLDRGSRIDIVVVDAEHLGQALVPIVDIAWMHLIEHEVIALVILLPQLLLKLVEVYR